MQCLKGILSYPILFYPVIELHSCGPCRHAFASLDKTSSGSSSINQCALRMGKKKYRNAASASVQKQERSQNLMSTGHVQIQEYCRVREVPRTAGS